MAIHDTITTRTKRLTGTHMGNLAQKDTKYIWLFVWIFMLMQTLAQASEIDQGVDDSEIGVEDTLPMDEEIVITSTQDFVDSYESEKENLASPPYEGTVDTEDRGDFYGPEGEDVPKQSQEESM